MPHLDSETVGRLATETSAGQVVITHVRMGTDLLATMAALRAEYPGPASLARPGARYLVPSG
jgi:ribonuclease BN (tRNA processing enzyme)